MPDGRVDIDAMVTRLKELGVTTYYWLIWHAPTDWDDLKLFLPKAAEAGIEVWVYLVPPSESPPKYGSQYSEPFRLDYHRWAEEIARLSLQHPNLTAWVIDDFYANHAFFTPAYLREMQTRSKGINPRLAFLPLMYFQRDHRQVRGGLPRGHRRRGRGLSAGPRGNRADVGHPQRCGRGPAERVQLPVGIRPRRRATS